VTDAGKHRAEFSNFKLQIVVVAGQNQNFVRIGIELSPGGGSFIAFPCLASGGREVRT
jgi:hypothetical protein